jgi:2-(1,2-epoxy-1,2-dihydrophenyl)acetyl-CoA isomerase
VGILLVDRADGVVVLTLNRPERRNGITVELVEVFVAALQEIAATPADRVLVLTGAAGSFCSGMDLTERVTPDELTFMRRVGVLCRTLRDLPIPTLASVRGGAIGLGANLALCADLVLAAQDAVFGEVFAARGIGLDGGGSWSLPHLLGPQKAKEIAFFGQSLTGRQAADLGMVNAAVPDAELDALTADWARRLAAGPRRALSLMKAQINAAAQTSFAAAIEAESVAQAMCFKSPEAKEGIGAFLARRAPDFRKLDEAGGN